MQRDCTPPGSCRLMTRSRQKSRKSIRGGLAAGCWLSRFRSILRFPECGQVIAASISSFCRRLNHSTSSFEKCVQTHNAGNHGTRIIESRHSCCTQKYPKGDESKKITNKKTRSCLPLRKTASLLCRYELNQLK